MTPVQPPTSPTQHHLPAPIPAVSAPALVPGNPRRSRGRGQPLSLGRVVPLIGVVEPDGRVALYEGQEGALDTLDMLEWEEPDAAVADAARGDRQARGARVDRVDEVAPGVVIVLAGRGVQWAPWHDQNGLRILVAVDSCGRLVDWRTVRPTEDWRAMARELQRRLDADDPPRGDRLELVD